ncbi:MAG: hypothetical protein K2L01_06050, partial [Rikenellaceae bacterium]|nr:hypothetical protein [Rikenellaceae bacterium]
IAPVTFLDRLDAGKQATVFVGYSESGNIKIGSPDNWGNVGSYELSDGVKLQVIGGEFFDYKSIKALRAYSGGSEFSCIVKSADGVATLTPVGTVDWISIRDNIVTVSPNSGAERECRVAVSVGGKSVGVFYVHQGRNIEFTDSDGVIIENNLFEMVGAPEATNRAVTVSFDIEDEELDGLDIVPRNSEGLTVTVDRETKTLTCYFTPAIFTSKEYVLPIDFIDMNGTVQSTFTFVQRPVKFTFNPVRYKPLSYKGGSATVSITVDVGAEWQASVSSPDGDVKQWITPITGDGKSGGTFTFEVAPNDGNTIRRAYITVRSLNSQSEEYCITQMPSYGICNLSADICWDADDATLRAYSKGRDYTFTFNTDTAIPEGTKLAINCDPDGLGAYGIAASEIINTSDNAYSFTVTVPDSENLDEEETSRIDITADDIAIGSFTVIKAFKPSFVSFAEEVWGGVKDRPELRKAIYRASDWDIESLDSDNESLKVATEYHGDIKIFYADELMYDSEPQEAVITMTLKGGNSVSYTTKQAPVEFFISDTDMLRLRDVSSERTEVNVTVFTKAGSSTSPWRVNSLKGNNYSFLSSRPNVSGTETNASGTDLTIIFSANTSGNRTGYFTLKSRNTTSQRFDVSQRYGIETLSIGGVEWTLYNLDYPKSYYGGTLAEALPSTLTGMRLSSLGRLYQWGYNVAWKSESSQSGWSDCEPWNSRWQSTVIEDSLWTDTPCPDGFRLPTANEFQNLINACNITPSDEDTWGEGKIGYVTLTDKTDSNRKLEFPALKNRSSDGGYYSNGRYWSSQYNAAYDNSSAKDFFVHEEGVIMDYDHKLHGYGIRCVLR